VAVINILDTCITNLTINDTITTEVFDTTYVTQTIYDTVQVTEVIYDTITSNINIYDTITTNITMYDTITTNITIYDTITTINYISVTDTLIINATLGVQPNLITNSIKVYPNPANTHITIDYGDFASMSGYSIKIVNALGQEVFSSAINQQTSFIDLSTWSGNGVYFVQLIDQQSNMIENRKIVMQ
jgi:hypothetical protein